MAKTESKQSKHNTNSHTRQNIGGDWVRGGDKRRNWVRVTWEWLDGMNPLRKSFEDGALDLARTTYHLHYPTSDIALLLAPIWTLPCLLALLRTSFLHLHCSVCCFPLLLCRGYCFSLWLCLGLCFSHWQCSGCCSAFMPCHGCCTIP